MNSLATRAEAHPAMVSVDAAAYARALLADFGIETSIHLETDHPALAWRRAGLQEITGDPKGPGRPAPVALTAAADGVLAALRSIAADPSTLPASGAALLGERARLMGLTRKGRAAPGGSCRLYETADGLIALNLARTDDVSLLPAWLEVDDTAWAPERDERIDRMCRLKKTEALVSRGREMGLAVARADAPPRRVAAARLWVRMMQNGRTVDGSAVSRAPLVVDLSSLWAGPLAASLLGAMGARVVKVEAVDRPDGGRKGNRGFYKLLNAGKACAAFDFRTADGRRALMRLLEAADIVVEGSRPRALRQLGVDADAMLAARPGKVWLSITAYGRTAPRADWVGFGDDVGAAAGLCALMKDAWGDYAFVGDAIADPLTGLHAALAAWAAYHKGGGQLIDISLFDVVSHAIASDPLFTEGVSLCGRARAWAAMADLDRAPLYALRSAVGSAGALGAETGAVMTALDATSSDALAFGLC